MICPVCGRQPVHTVEEYHYLESGLGNVFVRGVGIDRCKCGQEYVQLPGVLEVHADIASALLNKNSLLTGREAKFLRKWLQLTSEEMANVLGYTRVTVSRWENEGPSAKIDRALRLYASAVRNISIDFEHLFPTINNKPEKNFRIVVGVVSPVLHYSVDPSMTVFTGTSVTASLEHMPVADLTNAFGMAQGYAKGVARPSEISDSAANQELALAA